MKLPLLSQDSVSLLQLAMTVLPISYDSKTKTVVWESTPQYPQVDAGDLALEVAQVNALLKDLRALPAAVPVPPPPSKEAHSQQLSQMVHKMHQAASALMKSQQFGEAAHKFTLALGLAVARSKFEPFQMTLPEVLVCLIGRCDAYTNARQFALALQDADMLCLIGAQIPDNHLRRGIAHTNLGLLHEGKVDIERGLSFNAQHPILQKMHAIVLQMIKEQNGDD